MCAKIFGLLAILAFSMAPVSLAQEKLEAEALLGWLPEGYYQSIQYLDLSGFSEEGYALYKELVGDIAAMKRKIWPLPDSMIRAVVSAMQANLSNYREVEGDQPADEGAKTKTHQLSNIVISFVNANGDEVRAELEDLALELFVFHFEDPDFTIKKAIDAGEISETGETRYERKIYSFNWSSGGEFYLYPAVTGEVLVSADLPSLEWMIEAGMGLGLSMVDDSELRDFIDLVPELGPSWHKKGIESRLRTQLEMAERLDATEEYLESLREQLEKLPVINCSSVYVGEAVIDRSTLIFADEEAAKAEYEQSANQINKMYSRIDSLPELDKAWMLKDKRSRTVTLKDKAVVMEVRYDREYIEMIKQRRKMERERGKDDK